ncbi:MAG: aconitate hydratase [Acidobacteria bacterium]|nr:aconitate hydratase [Acidobacteriota bacterium]
MSTNLTRKIISEHLVEGQMEPGSEIALRIDQCLIQDATGTLLWQQFESFGLSRIKMPLAVTYVDHNILQTDFRNPDDHLFLQTMCQKYGAIFSRPGNGISHFAHLERFDAPGQTLVGADSHSCTAGAMAMLAIGAGGAEVATALAGEPFYVKMPRVVKVNLVGEFQPWVSAKDIILELLRRLSVKGGLNKVMEYVGPALDRLTVYERATICNMTQELGATSGLFPSDQMTRRFLRAQKREEQWKPLEPDPDATYDEELTIDLGQLEPLIAKPHSPDNVVPVREVTGMPVRQVAVGSSVNSSYRDIKVVAEVLKGKHVASNLHMTLSPGSRQILLNLTKDGVTADLVAAGVREMEVACGPCIGMGAAPPSGGNSVRTFNRNFPGRSGTENDRVWLCSPAVAAATALQGVLTDPRTLGLAPDIQEPDQYLLYTGGFVQPAADPASVEIYRGPNIIPPPLGKPLPRSVKGEVLIKLGDNVSTDSIISGGNQLLPLRSNIPATSEYTFVYVDRDFVKRAKRKGGGLIVAGQNYGQGSSREHAVLAPLYLGVKAVLALSYARIYESNLVNFGIPPLRFENPADLKTVKQGDLLEIVGLRKGIEKGEPILVRNKSRRKSYWVSHQLSARQVNILLAGGLTQHFRKKWGLGPAKQAKVRARS